MKKGKDNTKKVIDVKDNFMEEDNDKRVIIFVAIAILVIVGTIIGLLVGCEKKEEDDPVKPDNNKTTTPVKGEDDKKDEDVEPTTKKVVVKKLSTKTENTTKTHTKKLTVTFFMIDEKYSYMTEIENNSKVKAHEVSGYENCKYYTDETSNTEFDFTKNITKDTNIYMTCSLTTYTIKYDRASNNVTSYNVKDGNVELFDGYDAYMIFDGWYTDTAYTNKVTSLSPSIIKYADSENIINLYAKFVEYYTVSYYDEDNTLIRSEDLAKANLSNYTLIADYSCPNDAKLLGYTSSLGSSVIKYANNEVIEVTGNTNIYTKCGKATVIYVSEDATVFDVGCGSGILAIAAAKLGAKLSVGVDLDPVAVESSKENVKYNNLNNIEILEGNLVEVIDGKADVVVANILAEIICILTDDVKRVLKDNGIFITSGIIHDRVDMVCEKLEATGFEVIEKNRDGEWNCIVAKLK